MTPELNPSDWYYIGEGAKHALFCYVGGSNDDDDSTPNSLSNSCDNRFLGRLLRLRKDILTTASLWEDDSSDCNVPTTRMGASYLEEEEEGKDDSVFYIRNFVVKCLPPIYIDIPEKINVEWSFLKGLYNQTIASGRIPKARRKDWVVTNTSKTQELFFPKSTTCSSMLINDLRRIHRHRQASTSIIQQPNSNSKEEYGCSITIEIKPKAGYLPFSPLVDPNHKCKYEQSRFLLLQRLFGQGYDVKKGWVASDASKSIESSQYDPLDFFSQEPSRMRKAIDALFRCPQNNLKASFNDRLIFGHGMPRDHDDDGSSECIMSNKILAKCLHSDPEKKDSSSHSSAVPSWTTMLLQQVLTDTLIVIFSFSSNKDENESSLLRELLNAQSLDIIDADGAILVYNRLVEEFHNGSNKAAESAIDGYAAARRTRVIDPDGSRTSSSTTSIKLMRKTPFDTSYLSNNLEEFCKEIAKFDAGNAAGEVPQPERYDESRTRTVELMNTLTEEDCYFLLVNWLFSLAMCDTSIFVTLQLVSSLQAKEESNDESVHCEQKHESNPSTTPEEQPRPVRVVVDRNIDKHSGGPGRLRWSPSPASGRSDVSFLYEVKMVDLDRKPASKLRKRQERESLFQFLPIAN